MSQKLPPDQEMVEFLELCVQEGYKMKQLVEEVRAYEWMPLRHAINLTLYYLSQSGDPKCAEMCGYWNALRAERTPSR